MRNSPSEEALVAAYWRKLARSIERTYKSPGRLAPRPRNSKDDRSAFAQRTSNSNVRRSFGAKTG
jgi:hypothetical protein